MRSLMLASTAAVLLTAGIACAQVTTSAPAPTGAVNAPVETKPGLSPGNTAPPNATAGMSSNTITAAPSTGPANGAMADNAPPTPPMHKHHHHHDMMGTMTADTGAAGYLRTAQTDINKHDKAGADDALSHAETRLLTRSVPQSNTQPVDDSPAITSIENARKALSAGNMTEASSDTDMAMTQMHHGAHNGSMMSNGMSPPAGQ